jgi:hypothetical protein
MVGVEPVASGQGFYSSNMLQIYPNNPCKESEIGIIEYLTFFILN